jgi:O-antigen ligase
VWPVNASAQNAKFERLWALGIGVYVSFQLVVGALQTIVPSIENVLAFVSLALIGLSAWRLRNGLPSVLATWALGLLGAGLLLLGLQLVPLPVDVWTSLPGRQVVLDTFAATNITPGSMPITLDSFSTRSVALYILPSVSLFFASLSVLPKYRRDIAIVIVGVAVMCALLGLVQRFQGGGSIFYLFPNPAVDNFAKGTFPNRNFFAAQLFTSVPLVAALGVATLSGRNLNRFVVAVMLAVYFVALMAALGASGSRGGLALAMLAVLTSCALVWSGRNVAASVTNTGRIILPMMLLAILLIAQFGLVGLLRIAQTDTASDLRSTMAATTIEAIRAYFPVGSGFGSFVPVYKLFEHVNDLQPKFINNAHNDWLQLILEGGLPIVLLLFGFVTWYLVASFKIWRRGTNSLEDLLLRAATLIILLLLAHSFFDYPLRTRPLMGLFAICCGFLAYGVHLKPAKVRTRKSEPTATTQPTLKPVRTAPFFVKKDDR